MEDTVVEAMGAVVTVVVVVVVVDGQVDMMIECLTWVEDFATSTGALRKSNISRRTSTSRINVFPLAAKEK
jgi:hypothetical protein